MKEISRRMLENILECDIPDIEGKELWIWGVGNTAQLFTNGLDRLKCEKFEIAGYCDSDKEKWDTNFCGKKVGSPSNLKGKKDICVLICSLQTKVIREIRENLEEMGLRYYLLSEVILKKHKDEVLKCYDLLETERSKNLYANIINSRIKGDYKALSDYFEENTYFADKRFISFDQNEIFVDCGAYVGDSIERYVWKKMGIFKRIIAFDPDRNNYNAMKKRIERLCTEWNISKDKIEIYPYGVGEKTEEMMFIEDIKNSGLSSKVFDCAEYEDIYERGGMKKNTIVSLDDFLKEPYSFLKADIEGYEYKMLLGARKSIKKHKPVLAICIYHNEVDLYSIPLLIKTILPEYKIDIHHHSCTYAETVLYAWVEK